jgi:hypothetical protein
MLIFRDAGLRANLLIPAFLLATAWQAHAVQWTLSQAGPPTWTYTLTFAPEDNYSIYQSNTTITMTGLSGVTAAGGPTSTDFPSLQALQLAWTPQVTNGGTTVIWTHVGSGTGNFSTTLHVFGFSITAASALNGSVSYATSGMSRDVGDPLPGGGSDLDISGTVSGPSATAAAVSARALSPFALVLTSVGLALAGGYQARSRLAERLRNGG